MHQATASSVTVLRLPCVKMPGGGARRHSRSNSVAEEVLVPPLGPLSGPSDLTWRRQRLLQIGNERSLPEDALLQEDLARTTSYGTLPPSPTAKRSGSKLNIRRGLGSLPGITLPRTFTSSSTNSPVLQHSPLSFRERSIFRGGPRPISAYDRPVGAGKVDTQGNDADVKTNGIRVWYSSFTSIDWLHDVIKDSARHGRLRKRKSTRGRLRRQMDRSLGWVIVTIVGFLTAIVAFMIVRSEQWLFDIKEGYCTSGWYKAKRFCCPVYDERVASVHPSFLSFTERDACSKWRLWGEVFAPVVDGNAWTNFWADASEYVIYILFAVCFHRDLETGSC